MKLEITDEDEYDYEDPAMDEIEYEQNQQSQ